MATKTFEYTSIPDPANAALKARLDITYNDANLNVSRLQVTNNMSRVCHPWVVLVSTGQKFITDVPAGQTAGYNPPPGSFVLVNDEMGGLGPPAGIQIGLSS
jgi:hypothetical protein